MSSAHPTFAARALAMYAALESPRVPRGVQVMNPYRDDRVREYVRAFLDAWYDDHDARVLVFGINPGRFGAGVTGITFTDPVALADECGIANHLGRRRELSSIFMYQVIHALGGPAAFFRRYFLSAVSPLGFLRRGLNLNYYDDRALLRAVTRFIENSVAQHVELGRRRDRTVVLGTGDNARCFRALNERHRWFREVLDLAHPRFIMQYRRRQVGAYITKYAEVLGTAAS